MAKLTALKIALGRRLLRGSFHLIRPKRFYEPVELAGRHYSEKREAKLRWSAIADAVRRYEAKSILDIGCAEAGFLRQAAAEFGTFGIGIEAADRRVLTGEIARLHDGVERVATVKAKLAPDDIRTLPVFDLVLCLSVAHHVMRSGGVDAARVFVSAIASRVGKALLFEMGTSAETSLGWTKALPPMPEGQEAFVSDFLRSCGFTDIRVVASTPGLRGDAPRLLFVAEPVREEARCSA